jgi:hypothetical protein
MNCDPKALLEAAKCFQCLPHKSITGIWVYLACQWANSSVAPENHAPETPVMSIENNRMISTTTADGNTGGTCELWLSTTGEFGVYASFLGPIAWIAVKDFGNKNLATPMWIKSKNIGDGTNRIGDSLFSNAIQAI